MTKPSWDDVQKERRGETDGAEVPFDHITKALERIGDTADGKVFREWLHDSILMPQPARGLDESALRDITAEKRFAHRLYKALEPKGAATAERKQRTAGRIQRPAASGREITRS